MTDKDGNWINGMNVLFLNKKDRDYWNKLCKAVEEGLVPAITLRGVKYDLARHGKLKTTDAYPHRVYCSECYKTLIPNVEWCYEKNEFPQYCMWCGAKMEDEGQDEKQGKV